jgi:hypothetical protein
MDHFGYWHTLYCGRLVNDYFQNLCLVRGGVVY